MINKEDIYVIVDTPKKEKKLTKILEKFGETIFTRPDHKNISHNGKDLLGWAYGYSNSSWQEVYTRPHVLNGKSFTEVSVKQLKTILKAERTKREVEDILVELESQKHEVPNIEFELTPDDYKNNTWYRSKDPGSIFFLEKGKKSYGFSPNYLDSIEWFKHFRENGFHIKGQWTEATEQDVLEAFTKEANKWFKVGDRIVSPDGTDYGYKVDSTKYRLIIGITSNTFCFIANDNIETHLFKDGRWAAVIEEDKFAELKEAHKNGAIIQFREKSSPFWIDVARNKPSWVEGTEYRIKPEEKPKVGDICKLWCNNENDFIVAKLCNYSPDSNYPYHTDRMQFRNAKTLTKEETIELLFKN